MKEFVHVYLVNNSLIHMKEFLVEHDVIIVNLIYNLLNLMKQMDELVFLQMLMKNYFHLYLMISDRLVSNFVELLKNVLIQKILFVL